MSRPGDNAAAGLRIVAFPFHDWRKGDVEGRRWRDAHVIDALATMPEVERILVVDRPLSLAERAIRRRPGWARGEVAAERDLQGARARVSRMNDKVSVLDIHVGDVVSPLVKRRGWWFQTFAEARIHELIRWAAGAAEIDRPTVFAWTPTVAPAIRALEPRALLFDSLDNWISHARLRSLAGQAADAYADLLPTADVVVAPAPASRAILERWASQVTVIPNGVDPRMFEGPFDRPADLPDGPVVGYTGSLGSRIDAPLAAGTASVLPDVAFAFVGPIFERSAIRPLRGIPNVHVLGDRHYSRMPAYVANFDLAWIPHLVGEGETGGDPIKMYEYWAASREVVATMIDGLDQWTDRLHMVRRADDAATTIAGLLDGSIPAKHPTVPPDRTWDAIARQMLELLAARRAG